MQGLRSPVSIRGSLMQSMGTDPLQAVHKRCCGCSPESSGFRTKSRVTDDSGEHGGDAVYLLFRQRKDRIRLSFALLRVFDGVCIPLAF